MLTMNSARRLALSRISSVNGQAPEEYVVLDALTQCRRIGWVFFYEARAYLETGDATRAVGAPARTAFVIVSHRDEVQHFVVDERVEDVLRDLERARRSKNARPGGP
jgi:hypothetical protein